MACSKTDPPADTNNNNGNICKHDDPTQIVSIEETAATCQKTGLTSGLKCNLCGTFVTPQTISPVINCIESKWIVTKMPTHQEEGSRHTECTMCKKIFKQETLPVGSYGLSYKQNNDGTYTVTGVGTCTATDILIPMTHNEKAVTSIGYEAFSDCSEITKITIPNSVTSIGNGAFGGCSGLTSINIPNDITIIDCNTFFRCTGLTSITIPNNVTEIDGSAFSNCRGLTSINIPNSVTVIGTGAFSGCINIKSITFEGTVEEWNAIILRDFWNNDIPTTEVICSDGTVSLN